VYRTRVGYTGGAKDEPTYQDLGEHTESLQIDFDRTVMSYEELLEVFFASHSPDSPPYSVQYKSAIFYANEIQQLAAEKTIAALEEETGTTVYTDVLPLETFYLAEAYHQKYYLRKVTLLAEELEAKYPTLEAFLDAPSVTSMNGYVWGCGTLAEFLLDLPSFAEPRGRGDPEADRRGALGAAREVRKLDRYEGQDPPPLPAETLGLSAGKMLRYCLLHPHDFMQPRTP
jgi:peptide-methionine (S)-S-oxide reductase